MIAFLGIPDWLPYFDLLNHNTFLGLFIGAGGVQASFRAWRRHKQKN